MIALAIDTAEDMMRDKNPPAQIVTHYLKLGSSREKLEQLRLRQEVELMEARKAQLESQARVEELYADVIIALKSYSGQDPDDLEIIDDEY